MSKYFFIINPTSGRGKGLQFGKRLEDRLGQLSLDYDLAYTEKPLHASDIAAEKAQKFEVIVVVGGDGTLNEVVNGIHGTNAVLGILPVGSGNDFVRAVPIPVDLDSSLKILLNDKRKKIDLARINDRIYLNGVGIGFDAWAVHTGNKVTKLRGNAIYLYAVLHTLINFKSKDIEITINGQTYTKDFFLMTIANGVALGGGFHLTPDALIDDGLLDVCLVENMHKLDIIRNLLKVYSGKHKEDPRVKIINTDKVFIRSEDGFAVHADGELLSLDMKEIDIEILPKSIDLVC